MKAGKSLMCAMPQRGAGSVQTEISEVADSLPDVMTNEAPAAGRPPGQALPGQAGVTVPVVVATTQVVAWGTTFYPVSVLAHRIADGIGAPVAVASAEPTVLLAAHQLALGLRAARGVHRRRGAAAGKRDRAVPPASRAAPGPCRGSPAWQPGPGGSCAACSPSPALIEAISLNGFVSGGLPLVFIPLFTAAGLSQGLSVAVSSALGIIQAAARALTLALRLPAITEVLAATCVMVAGVAVLFLLPGGGTAIIAVARATLPHELFSPASYAQVSGVISLPLNLVYAISPTVFAATLTRSGATAVALAVVLILGAVACLLALRTAIRHTENA
jgi:hypothetical protein